MKRYAILGVDPGMRSGAAVGVVRNRHRRDLQFTRIWTTVRRQAAVIDEAFAWAMNLTIPVYVQVEGPFAQTARDLQRDPGSIDRAVKDGRITVDAFRKLHKGVKKGRVQVMRLTGVYAVEQSAGAWHVETERRLRNWCAREPWVVWASKVTGIRMPARAEQVNPVLRQKIDALYPGWDANLSKSAQDHVLDALGQVEFRGDLLALGLPHDRNVKVR